MSNSAEMHFGQEEFIEMFMANLHLRIFSLGKVFSRFLRRRQICREIDEFVLPEVDFSSVTLAGRETQVFFCASMKERNDFHKLYEKGEGIFLQIAEPLILHVPRVVVYPAIRRFGANKNISGCIVEGKENTRNIMRCIL